MFRRSGPRRPAIRLGILTALMSLLSAVPANAQNAGAPYIYYYSDRLNAFVVERADGTQTRIVGDGLMPESGGNLELAISGPGWSPSGRWFAWNAGLVGSYNRGTPKPYAIRSDGGQRLVILDDLPEAAMAWAPHDDLLLVASQYVTNFKTLDVPTFIALLDPALEAPIAAVRTDFHTPPWPGCAQDEAVTWTQDGYGIAQYVVGPNGVAPDSAQISFFVVNTKGMAYTQTRQSLLGPFTHSDGCSAAVSVRGDIAYQRGTSLVIENLISRQQHVIDHVFQADTDFQYATLLWNSDGQYGLLFLEHDTELASLSLLSVARARLTALSASIALPALPNLELSRPTWSPDGRHALIGAYDGNVYHVTAEPPAIDTPLKFPASWVWTGDGKAVIGENANASNGNDPKQPPYTLYTYDFNAGTRSLFASIPSDGGPGSSPYGAYSGPLHQFALSPDGHSMGYVQAGATIHDISTGLTHHARPSPRGFYAARDTGDTGEVAWSKDSDWLLVYEDSGGSQGYSRNLGLVRADGTMLRALTYSSETPEANMLAWLPDQVKPEYLPPLISKPFYLHPQAVLRGSSWPFFLAWSPDGQEILAISTVGVPTLWNVAAGSSSTISLPPSTPVPFTFPKLKGWAKGVDNTYKPIIAQEKASSTIGKWKGLPMLSTNRDTQEVLVSDDDFASIHVLDARTGQQLHHLSLPHPMTSAEHADFTSDGRYLALSGSAMPVQVWDTQSWQLVASLPDPSVDVAFSPDGKWLATGSSWDIDLWDVAMLAEPSQGSSGGK